MLDGLLCVCGNDTHSSALAIAWHTLALNVVEVLRRRESAFLLKMQIVRMVGVHLSTSRFAGGSETPFFACSIVLLLQCPFSLPGSPHNARHMHALRVYSFSSVPSSCAQTLRSSELRRSSLDSVPSCAPHAERQRHDLAKQQHPSRWTEAARDAG